MGIGIIIAICYRKLVFKFSTRIVQLMKCVPYKIELLYGTVSICLFIFGFILIPDVGDKEGLLGTISSNSSPLGLSTILSIFSTVNRIVLVSCATYSLSHVAWVMVYTSNYPISSIDAANLSITTSAKILFSMLKVKETRKLKFLILPFLIICLAAFSASESSIIQYLIKSEVESNPSSVSLQYRNTSLLSSRKFLTSKGVLTNAGVKLIYRALSDVQDHGSLQVSEMLYCPSHYLYCVGQVLIATDYQLNCTSNSTMITTFSESNASRTIDSSFDSSHQWTISRDISTALDEGRKSKRSIDD
ncbi:hypothetical protein BC833DRAFT_577599 [Globomyces pollinis-pini]|nr:hypothetical protein BC833DRAFT_577599 [Globomyces pollinis-pini]